MKKFIFLLGSILIVIAVLVVAIIPGNMSVISGISMAVAGISYLIFGAIIERQDRIVAAIKALDFDPIDRWAARYGRRLTVDAALVTGPDKPVKAWFESADDVTVEPDDQGGYTLRGKIMLEYPEFARQRHVRATLNFDADQYRKLPGWSIADLKITDIR